jgi:hypothetical protein
VASRDRVDAVRGEGEGADIRAPLAEGERAWERKWLMSGTERSAREGEGAGGVGARMLWWAGWVAREQRGRESGVGSMGRNRPSREGRGGFSFFFFSLLFFSLIPFLLYTNIHLFMIISRCQNEMLCVKCY